MVDEQQELVQIATFDCCGWRRTSTVRQKLVGATEVNWHNIFHVGKVDTLSDVLDRHKMVLDKGLGTIKGFTAEIKLQDGAKPIFCKACPVP